MRNRETKYRDSDKGKLTRKVSHIRERFKDATTDEIREKLNKALGTECKYCGAELTLDTASGDHAVSLYNKGTCDISNLDVICKNCNQAKSDLNSDIFGAIVKVAKKYGQLLNILVKFRKASLIFGGRR